MKKHIFLFLTTIVLSITACVQDRVPARLDCGEGIDIGTYIESYKSFNEKEWSVMTDGLNAFLGCKDIQASRDSQYAVVAWFTLMRISDIKWTSHKMEVVDYLNKFVKKILVGESYLTKSNKNILTNSKGCLFKNGDPMSIPYACYWVTLKIDEKSAVKLINDTWSEISIDESFSNNLRSNIINELKNHYKSSDVQLLLNKFEQTKMTSKDSAIIQEMKDKYEFRKSQNQSDAWKRLLYRSLSKSTNDLMTDANMYLWMDNMVILKDVFGDVNIQIPLELAEKETDAKIKYVLAYSCCWLLNSKYPNQSDERLTKRIEILVNDVEKQCLIFKKGAKGEIDYLNKAYQAFKKWQK